MKGSGYLSSEATTIGACTAPNRVICPLNHNNAGLWSLYSVSDSIQFSIAEIVEKIELSKSKL